MNFAKNVCEISQNSRFLEYFIKVGWRFLTGIGVEKNRTRFLALMFLKKKVCGGAGPSDNGPIGILREKKNVVCVRSTPSKVLNFAKNVCEISLKIPGNFAKFR